MKLSGLGWDFGARAIHTVYYSLCTCMLSKAHTGTKLSCICVGVFVMYTLVTDLLQPRGTLSVI